ncbi:hypothetical protein FHS82_001013 [Pseudochelatococcus lubricantis]|uniref:Uncharacterized protein n=1 Tax=Pseudochelatococcus lubricantis TaxID=1538102 RepID=A0ABX0UW51_9HYPH|nr:hypothetical protein [Pseudochelatococcus lubricantis]NIJ57187.1 hypothetical protein [Pseudochelatococcus lubricantis]
MANLGGGHLRLAHSNDSTEVLYNKGRGPGGTGGDGGGTSDPMEARVASLEAKFERVDVKLDAISRDLEGLRSLPERVAHIEGKISSMPSTGAMVFAIVTTGLAMIAIVFAVLAFAGDRFEGGIGLSAIRIEQAERDRERDETIKQILQRLPSLPVSPTNTP